MLIAFNSFAQCVIPTTEGDTTWPVVDRAKTLDPYGSASLGRERRSIYASTQSGNTFYLGGDFTYIGPNTGTGVLMDKNATTVTSPKKWRINGLVYASIPDGIGGYFIGGDFTRVGDKMCINIAHIDEQGMPYDWNPIVNNYVKAIVLKNDTLIIGGAFTQVNGQTRNGFAMLSKNANAVLPTKAVSDKRSAGSPINTFKLVDSILYVGGDYDIYNHLHSFFKVHIPSGIPSSLPAQFQMEDVYTLDASEDKRRIYIGGFGGAPYDESSNGYCMDAQTGALLFTIGANITIPPPKMTLDEAAAILSIKVHGSNVFVGGRFSVASVKGNGVTQKGIFVFKDGTGQIDNVLNNCNGFVTSIHAEGSQVYIGGEFSAIGGQTKTNFAIFDTLSQAIKLNTKSFSDHVNTMSFHNSSMFVGGSFNSVDGVTRNGFAAFDVNTGQISSWVPNIYSNELTDMKAKGDTIFMAGVFGQPGNSHLLGGLVAVNGVSGQYYTGTPQLHPKAWDLLIDGDNLYVGGVNGNYGNHDLVKINIPTLNQYTTWKPNPDFDVKSIQKKGNKIYVTGDNRRDNPRVIRGYVAEIDDSIGLRTKVFELSPTAVTNDLNWISKSCLIGDKLFITGLFNKIKGAERYSFAAISISDGGLLPTNINLKGSASASDMKSLNGNLYVSGSFIHVNDQIHKYFVVVDTSLGIPFNDRLQINNDDPVQKDLIDGEHSPGSELGLNTFHFFNNDLILGGDFRNINGKMFPGFVKLKMAPLNSPPVSPGIQGKDSIPLLSQNNIYSIALPDASIKYGWYYSGNDVTITGNGSSSVKLEVGAAASPGYLKAVAISECGKSDTAYLKINLRTTDPTVNTTSLFIARRTDTSATIKFTKGNGAARIIIVKKAATIIALPQDGFEYSANSKFAFGSNIGDSSFVVYRAAGDSVNLFNLAPASLYYVTAYEFNGSGTAIDYSIANNQIISFSTNASLPAIQASNITFSNKTTTTITINCTPGNGQKRLVVIRKEVPVTNVPANGQIYNANTEYSKGADLGNQTFVVSNANTPVTVTNLQPSTRYYVSIFEFNGDIQTSQYLLTNTATSWFVTKATEPTIPASNIVITSIKGTTVTINCTAGNGSARLVVVRENNPVTDAPVDNTNYNYNTAFGIGSSIGNNSFVVRYFTPVNVFNLRSEKTYHVKVFEFNGFDSLSNYLTDNAPTATFTTISSTPTLQAANLYFHSIAANSAYAHCTNGNGQNRLIVIRKDNPVTDNPVDGQAYAPSNTFGDGGNIGNNSYAINNFSTVNNLVPGSTYYAKAFEFSGTGTATKYLINNAPVTSFTTLAGAYTLITNLKATQNNQSVLLDWKTEKEVNNLEFQVERSQDSINFSLIGSRASQASDGNSNTVLNYNFIDGSPLNGQNFYRLKQLDKDGKYRYSDVIKMNFTSFKIESLNVSSVTSCSADFSSMVTSFSNTISSIGFEYGNTAFNLNVTSVPNSITNGQGQIKATVSGLIPGASYKMRMKFYFSGTWHYSDEVSFTTQASILPLISASGVTTFCSGGNVVLTTPINAGHLYEWQRNDTPISNAATNQYAVTVSGSYTVKVTNPNACSVISAPILITETNTLSSPVIAITGSTTICAGNSSMLSSSALNGNQWYRDSVLITGATAQTYNPTISGRYTVRTSVGSCISPYSTGVMITVNSLPAIAITQSGPTSFCQGENVVLSSTQNSGSNYQWYRDGISIIGAVNYAYTAVSSGDYNVMVNNGNCTDTVNAIVVKVNPFPAKPVISKNGNILSSTATAGNQWLFNSTLIIGATNQDYLPQDSGQYAVRVTENGCTVSSDIFNFITASENPGEWSRLTIFPNPVTDVLNVKNPDLLKLNISIVNLSGNVVYDNRIRKSEIDINMQGMVSGVYWLVITNLGNGKSFSKFILKL